MLWLLFLHKKPLYQCPHTLHSYLLHLQLASLTTLRKIVPLPISSICHSALHCLIFLHDTYYFSIIYRSLLPQLFVSTTRMSIRVWNTCSLLYPLHMEQYLTHSRYSIKVMNWCYWILIFLFIMNILLIIVKWEEKERCVSEKSEKANGKFSIDWHSLSELNFFYTVICSNS